ncbi:MAG: ABC transporter permease [Deltaproteobacteria bacterium]|nr:MAG: ABC transporter permease [Deltaproteobacteria bacterium]
MLVLLLGAGRGLENGMRWDFRDDAVNSVWVYRGQTSIPWQGRPVGRQIRFDLSDIALLSAAIPEIDRISGRFNLRGEFTVSAGARRSSFSVRGVHPDHRIIEQTIMVAGRFIDPLDVARRRKVVVIGRRVADYLFPGRSFDAVLGRWVDVSGIRYRVVGVFEDAGGESEERRIYIPITTAQAAYGGGDEVHQILFTLAPSSLGTGSSGVGGDDGAVTVEESRRVEDRVRRVLARTHGFHPDDRKAIRIRSVAERYAELVGVFTRLRRFIWLVGVGTVLAGVVGVSNIMLISVRERTRELGLRKALGATPRALVAMIIQEALILTALSGYAGLVAGVGVLALVERYMPDNEYLRDPQVDLGVLVGATVVLVVAGVLAGWWPARRAAAVTPVAALRDE